MKVEYITPLILLMPFVAWLIESLFWPTHEIASEGYEQRMEEECRVAKVRNKERAREQHELAQQKTVRVKQYYRRKPKRNFA